MDCSPPGSSVHGISQARILEWVAISFCMGSSLLRDQTPVSCIGRRILYCWATREALKGALKDIYILELINLNMEGSFLKKLFLLHNMLNFFSLRRPFQITLARNMSTLLSLNIMFTKDHGSGSPGACLSFSTPLVPWLWQVTQLTFLSLGFPICKMEAALTCFTQLLWGLNKIWNVSTTVYGRCSANVCWVNKYLILWYC